MAKLSTEEKKNLALFLFMGSYRAGMRQPEAKKLAHKLGIIDEFNFYENDYKEHEPMLSKFFTPEGATSAMAIFATGKKDKKDKPH